MFDSRSIDTHGIGFEVSGPKPLPSAPAIRAVLGIDAAWTAGQPSGVALIVEEFTGWRLAHCAPSYSNFYSIIPNSGAPAAVATGSLPDPAELLNSVRRLCAIEVDVVAIDMPMAITPIIGRRMSDDAVSRAYGARHCSTHSPSAVRPGRISDDLRSGFEAAGYSLRTSGTIDQGLIEVYPHPALVELTASPMRLKYKLGRARGYWPNGSRAERRQRIIEEWRSIIGFLDREIGGVASALIPPCADAPVALMKAFEDTLDAVVCAWVGACALNSRALPFGDAVSAIWIPEVGATLR